MGEQSHRQLDNLSDPLISWLLTGNRPVRFVATFGICLLFGFGLLVTPRVQSADREFSRALVAVSHGLVLACGGHAIRDRAILRAPGGFAIEMQDGCNAVNVTILLWAAILAFPAPWATRTLGLLAGSLILQLLNILRFVSLFYLGQYNMAWFDFAHGYLWESLLVLDTMVVFWLWVNRIVRLGAVTHAGA